MQYIVWFYNMMSVNNANTWWHHRCGSQLQHNSQSSTRYRSVQLLYVLSLVVIISTLYPIYWSGPFSNALHNRIIRSESAVISVDANVQRVVRFRHHINDTNVATPTIHPSKASPPIPSSTTTTFSSLSKPTLVLVDPTHKTMTMATTLASTTTATRPRPSTTVVPPLQTTSNFSSLPIDRTSLLSLFGVAAVDKVVLSLSQSQSITRVDKYVGFYGGYIDGRGLGNQMFNLAAVIYVAQLTGRQPAILKCNYTMGLDEVSDLKIKRFDNLCPCYVFREKRSLSLMYDRRVEELANGSRAEDARGKSIFLSGFFQSWKYTQNVERRLRHHVRFLPEVRQFVDKFLEDSWPPGWVAGFVRVGIQVRRGDVLRDDKIKFGYTTPDERYFAHAMRYFVDRFERIQFIVASNDIDWCRQKLANLWTTLRHRVNVTFVTPRSAGKDLAVVASCEHVIMSTGTFGWWAAWLARGVTIYYADWPRNGSTLASIFSREDFFPPTWIGMT